MKDIWATVLSEYANSPAICTIIDAWNQALDPSSLIDLWYANVWNPDTATGYGLDVWGRIVGVSRVVQVAAAGYIGFSEADDGSGSALPFNQGIFYSGQTLTSNYALSDSAFRTLIQAKALANITSGSIRDINAILMRLFGDSGDIWVEDGGNMSMTIAYDFTPTPLQAAILQASGVLPRISGGSISYEKKS